MLSISQAKIGDLQITTTGAGTLVTNVASKVNSYFSVMATSIIVRNENNHLNKKNKKKKKLTRNGPRVADNLSISDWQKIEAKITIGQILLELEDMLAREIAAA